MSRKFLGYTGLAAVGAGTYYLYNAGGDPKLAEKQFECTFPLFPPSVTVLTFIDDAARASAKVRGELPGREKEAKKAGEEGFEAIRSKAKELVSLHSNYPYTTSY